MNDYARAAMNAAMRRDWVVAWMWLRVWVYHATHRTPF